MKNILRILIVVIIIFGLIQLIPIDRVNEPVKKEENFVDNYKVSPRVKNLIIAACYDCHSNEVKYPDYAYVAPISWMVKDHVSEGRERLNFSKWGTYNHFQKEGMMEKSIASVENYTMPLSAYILKHPEANLSKADRELMTIFFREVLKDLKEK
ncbi:heme-binding domain-containing protein [Chryseobacterium sp. TY4]